MRGTRLRGIRISAPLPPRALTPTVRSSPFIPTCPVRPKAANVKAKVVPEGGGSKPLKIRKADIQWQP